MAGRHAEGGRKTRPPFSAKVPDWLELWSLGVYNLGLAPDDFWRLTLAQLDALVRRYNETQEKLDYRAALICMVLANCNRNPKKKPTPFRVEDFMPKRKNAGLPKDPEQLMNYMRLTNAAMGGKEVINDG